MDSILITGATGLLGSSLLPHLRRCGYKVASHGLSKNADFVFDLSDIHKTLEVLEKLRPKVIVNLVSLTNVERCEDQVNLAYKSNTRSVENLVQWIESSGTECHLLQISTDHVYDALGPHTEDKITLTNSYAFSKYAGELAAQRVPSTILRTNFVGRSQTSSRESFTDWIYKSLISNRQIEVLTDVFFSPLSIVKLVEMIELAIQKKPIGIYNLGSHNGMSKADFCFAFAKTLSLPLSTMKHIETGHAKFLKVYRPKDMRMDSSKFENLLDIKLPDLTDLIQLMSYEYNEII